MREAWNKFNAIPGLGFLVNSLRSCLGEDIENFLYFHTHAPFILEEVKRLSPGSKVLEAGWGLGYWAFWISEQGHRAVGVDISEKAISLIS